MAIIGIDFGTTNSIVYVFRPEIGPKVVPIAGNRSTPSVVFIDPGYERIIVGNEARKRILISPDNAIISNKRFIGDPNKEYKIGNQTYTPVEVASYILKYLADQAAIQLNEVVEGAVITVPAYFNSIQNAKTIEAANMAGLKVLKLLKEPSAAAIYYAFDKGKAQTLLIYDFGGGTFDVSILQVNGNEFDELSIDGDTQLGGDDFNDAILRKIVEDLVETYSDYTPEDIDYKILEAYAEDIKIRLSQSLQAEEQIILHGGKYNIDFTLSRKEFNLLIHDYVERSISIMKNAVKKAGITNDDINRIVLVGGSSKTPYIAERIAQEFKEPYFAHNVDEIVAAGAAILSVNIQAPVPSEKTNLLPLLRLTNVTAFNIGVKALKKGGEGDFSIIIPEQSKIPCSAINKYTTFYDNQQSVHIAVYQGHGALVNSNEVSFIGGFIFSGFALAPSKTIEIDIKFSLTTNDILEVIASHGSSNTQTIELDVQRCERYEDIFGSRKSDIFFLFDVSGSMRGRRIAEARRAAKKYAELKRNTEDRIACFVYGYDGAEVFGLSDNIDYICSRLDTVDVGCYGAGGGTKMIMGLEKVLAKIQSEKSDRRYQIIVLSDGFDYGRTPKQLIPLSNMLGVVIHAVGIGKSYDRKLLEFMATNTGGVFTPSEEIDNLVEVFTKLAEL